VIGTYHQISVKHLNRYLSEFQFKWNHRKAQDIFVLVIAALVIGAALPYKELIASIDEEPGAGSEATLDGEPF
jgi:ISXO2-like transposase domain